MSESADTDGWEVVGKTVGQRNRPQLTVYANGGGYINASADRQILDKPDACRVLVDAETNRLAFDPVDGNHSDGYSLTRDVREGRGAGGDIRINAGLKQLGIDVDDLEETAFIELEAEGDLAVADLTDLVEQTAATRTGDRDLDATSAADDIDEDDESEDEEEATDDEPEDSQPEDNPVRQFIEQRVAQARHDHYEFTAATIRDELGMDGRRVGAKLRALRNDDDVPIDVRVVGHNDDNTANYVAEPRGGAASPPMHDVKDAVESVDSIQGLADELDVSEGRARTLAMDAEVYQDLEDNIPRPGVSR